MRNLAVIAARGGSKRIPKKNIREFLGKPIIAYPIENAIKAGCFDTVMVSTDDSQIARVATEYGATIPFMRSATTSNDHAPISAVVNEVLEYYAANNQNFDFVCCMLGTAVFATSSLILQARDELLSKQADSVFPIVRFSYPVQRALIVEDGFVQMQWPENAQTRSNDLPPMFHDSGLFYWLSAKQYRLQKRIFMERSIGIELSELAVQDIDTETDWKLAELKYGLLNVAPT